MSGPVLKSVQKIYQKMQMVYISKKRKFKFTKIAYFSRKILKYESPEHILPQMVKTRVSFLPVVDPFPRFVLVGVEHLQLLFSEMGYLPTVAPILK